MTAPIFLGLVLWNEFVNPQLLIRQLSMNDGEMTVYGWIVLGLFVLETVLSIVRTVLGVVKSNRLKKLLLLSSGVISALPCAALIATHAYLMIR